MKELLSVTNHHYSEPHEYKSLRKGDMLLFCGSYSNSDPAVHVHYLSDAPIWLLGGCLCSGRSHHSAVLTESHLPATSVLFFCLKTPCLFSAQFNCLMWSPSQIPRCRGQHFKQYWCHCCITEQTSCILHLCNVLLYIAANLSFHLDGSFLSLMAKGQQIFGYELGGNLTHI